MKALLLLAAALAVILLASESVGVYELVYGGIRMEYFNTPWGCDSWAKSSADLFAYDKRMCSFTVFDKPVITTIYQVADDVAFPTKVIFGMGQ